MDDKDWDRAVSRANKFPHYSKPPKGCVGGVSIDYHLSHLYGRHPYRYLEEYFYYPTGSSDDNLSKEELIHLKRQKMDEKLADGYKPRIHPYMVQKNMESGSQARYTMSGLVKLIPSDDDKAIVEIPLEIACMSVTIKTLLEDTGCIVEVPILLRNVTKKVLDKVVEYCKYHAENPAKPDTTDAKVTCEDISQWDKNFCIMDQTTLFELFWAANSLEIDPLLDLTGKTIDNMKTNAYWGDWGISDTENDSTTEEDR